MKFSRYDRPYEEISKWKTICPEGTWKQVKPTTLRGMLPQRLLSKTNSVLVMSSGNSLSSVFVANLNRVDRPASAIDQEPYIIAFDHTLPGASGGFVHHGSWSERTILPNKGFFSTIATSGIQAYYPLSEMPATGSGLIKDLPIDSQKEAFWISLSALQNMY